MCLFTHFAAGALAGGATGNVWVGAAAGLASHAVLDAIPHYDHPDWRLELSGGLASLVLLLLLPFATAPAVVGGVMGMVPDLENLFQKLGWMGRDRFVFPSHTGLVPHGRELGPRTLVWQVAIFVACFGLLGLLNPQEAAAAAADVNARLGRPEVVVLGADEGTTVVRVTLPVLSAPDDWRRVDPRRAVWAVAGWTGEPGRENEPPIFPVSLAVPTRGEVGVRVLDLRWWREPDDPDAAATMVRIGRPAVRRGVPVAGAAVVLAPGGGILRDVTLEFTHPASGQERENLRRAAGADPRVRGIGEPAPPGLMNPDLYARLRRGELARAATVRRRADKASPGGLFAATTHWVKLDVPATGFYRVTGADLAEYGVATAEVDPVKLRLYRGGGLHLDENPEVPDSLQAKRIGLNEVAIDVVDGGDGEWNLDDELRFYGVGTSTWLDRFDPAAGRLDHYDHPFCATAVYWLTWESDAVPSPLPGAPRRVASASAPALGAPVVAAGQVRLHREEQVLDERGLVVDGFVWTNNVTSSRTEEFVLRNPLGPVDGEQARFAVEVRAAAFAAVMPYEAQAWLNGDQAGMGVAVFTSRTQQDSLRIRVLGTSTAAIDGTNVLTLRNGVTGNGQRLALDAFAVMVPCALDLRDGGGVVEFGLWGDEVTTPATPADLRVAAPAPAELLLWDVTIPDSAIVHVGTAGAADVTYGLVRNPGVDRHFIAAQGTDLQRVAGGRRVRPMDLRAAPTALDYLVVAPDVFANAAGDLAAFRATSIPGITAPAAAAVRVEDIYDNFAGGQKDLRAIRNYLKWMYAAGSQRLRYVCFLGNASRDPRNWKNKTPLVDLVDWVPTEIRTRYPDNPYAESRFSPYASDDGLVSFDAAPPGDVDLPDLASARIAALDQAEARSMVDRIIAYARDTEPGAWRNHVVLVADDANRPGFELPITGIEPRHTAQAEKLAEFFLPPALDVRKIFAVDYPFPPGSGIKPQVRQTINAALNAGTTMYYYVGHGAEDNLADEQIFRSQDIAGLTNGMRRFVFLAFSCDVGVFDSIVRRSMAEQFVAAENGGAVAAICASQVSYVSDNELLSEKFYEALYPDRGVDPGLTLGEALAAAKGAMSYAGVRANSQRYTLFGDPATRLPHPDDDLAFAPGSVDTLRTGQRHVAVVASGGAAAMLGAGDGYDLHVGDSAYETTFVAYNYTYVDGRPVFDLENPLYFPWIKAGSPVFRGTGTMGGADLRVPFKAPLQLGTGERGRVRLILDGPEWSHTAVRTVPVVTGATGPVDDVHGPLIRLNPAEKAVRVPPGSRFEATFYDTSGIAMLGTNAGNSILLEFDDSGFMTNVTGSFAYDPDSYMSGSMAFTLPADLAPGSHTAALYAADALGNVGSDTLAFELSVVGAADIRTVTVDPNPTPGPCRLVFELTDPMEVRWDIYTLAGRRIRSILERFTAAGARIMEWDGRDGEGDELANGTYLYVVRGLAVGADGRDINRTGKLVIMR